MKVFNVLKRWLLVLVCSVGSVCASSSEEKAFDAGFGRYVTSTQVDVPTAHCVSALEYEM